MMEDIALLVNTPSSKEQIGSVAVRMVDSSMEVCALIARKSVCNVSRSTDAQIVVMVMI